MCRVAAATRGERGSEAGSEGGGEGGRMSARVSGGLSLLLRESDAGLQPEHVDRLDLHA